jgi:hypothetical protein
MLRLCSPSQAPMRQNQISVKTPTLFNTVLSPSRFGSNLAMRGKGNTMVEKLLSLSETERNAYLKDGLILQELTLDYLNRLDALSNTAKNHASLGKQQTELKQIARWLDIREEDCLREIAQHLPQ